MAGTTQSGGVVGLVVPDADGGIAAHVGSLVRRLPALGWEVRVCAPAAVLGRLGTAPLPGVRLVAVEVPATIGAALDPRGRWDLARALAGVDVVAAQGLRAGRAALAAAAPGVGVLVTWHNPPPARGAEGVGVAGVIGGLVGPVLARRVAAGATATLAASVDLLSTAVADGARHADLLEVAAPAGEPGDAARAAALRRQLDLRGRRLVVTAGRLTRQKDHATAIRAVLQIPAHRRPVLAVAGGGPDRAALAALADDLDVGLRLLGERADVADLLVAGDAAVLSSRWEARSLFAQEALRAGAPLVATAVGGLPGLLGPAALLVPPGDPAMLGAALDRILSDQVLAAGMVEAGRRRAAGWPDEDDTARAVAQALARVRLLAWDSVER